MKTSSLFCILMFFLVSVLGFSQTVLVYDDFATLGQWQIASGQWQVNAQGSLIQANINNTMTHIVRQVEQSGIVMYSFDLGYLGGIEDNYGGVGIHMLINNPTNVRSWGNGNSYLLWLTYDIPNYNENKIFAQMYKSSNLTTMNMMHRGKAYPVFRLTIPPPEKLKNYEGRTVPVTIIINTNTGQGKVFHPFKSDTYYSFNIGGPVARGSYFSFRTNSLAIIIDNFKVVQMPN